MCIRIVYVWLSEEELEARPKRQIRARGHRDFDAGKIRRTQNRLAQNECQNEVLVDCGGQGGIYECVTGPGEI